MSVELTTNAIHPWHGGWCDFFFEYPDSGPKGVVTLRTLGSVMVQTYDEEFGHELTLLKKGPGAYRDEELGLRHSKHCYTIMVRGDPAKPGMIKAQFERRLDELNEKYDLDLELKITEKNNEIMLPHEVDT